MAERGQQQSLGDRLGRALGTMMQMARHPEESVGNRRDFVGGVTVAGIVARVGVPLAALAVEACDPIVPVSDCSTVDGTDSCAGLPELQVPSEYKTELHKIILPFKLLLPLERQQNLKLFIHSDNNDSRNDGQGIAVVTDTITNIHIFLKDTQEAELNRAKETVFHESAHIFDGCVGNYPSAYVGQTAQKFLDAFIGEGHEDNGDILYSLLTESTYTGNIREGHPSENNQELFASTLNVMNITPDKFLVKVKSAPASIQKAVAVICVAAIESLQKFSSNPIHRAMTLEQFLAETKFPYTPDFVQELRAIAV